MQCPFCREMESDDAGLLGVCTLRRELRRVQASVNQAQWMFDWWFLVAPYFVVQQKRRRVVNRQRERNAELATRVEREEIRLPYAGEDYLFPRACFCPRRFAIIQANGHDLRELVERTILVKLVPRWSLFHSIALIKSDFLPDFWSHLSQQFLSFIEVSTLCCVSTQFLRLYYSTRPAVSHTTLLQCTDEEYVLLNKHGKEKKP
jgi:hypothetical protein